MKAHDWQLQQNLLHQHSNIKHMKLDRRGPDTPVIERFTQTEASWVDAFILIACGVILGVVGIGLWQGWL